MTHSNNDPRPYQYTFCQNTTKLDIFDLVDGPNPTALTYVRMSRPQRHDLRKNGAKYILESHVDNQRILFTGLKPLAHNWLYGDSPNRITNTEHTIAVNYRKGSKELRMYVFPFDFENNTNRRNFLIHELRKGHRR